MRSADPTLPSISYVLSQAQTQPRRLRRRPSIRVRRAKSSPSFSPHRPLYPPQLESDYLMKTVDYRFSPPPCLPTRSSFALPAGIFDEEIEIEIVASSPTDSETSSSSSSSSASRSSAASSARRKAKFVWTYVRDALETVRFRWSGLHSVRKTEARLSFDLCN
ncbi:hypothetical protein BV25DRAFT_1919522 [Artomyces pyxidatus]|uniref:Uncharacterized protein n=1 Tax=Artomyces pyxidatus TaxID=48021 RepID=A0ACB8SPX6_9AGAM|nr:hypothetical protein BV25DRAFT_1919522 [Artomyces pyxidatus]